MSGSDPGLNVVAHLRRMARERPYQRAVVCPRRRDAGGRVAYAHLTYAQLDRESDRVARGLERLGVRRGTRSVLMVRPGLDFFVVSSALFKVGAIMVLVDPGIGRRRLGICLDEAEPAVFIGVPAAHAARVALGWARGSLRTLVTVGRRWAWGGHALEELRDDHPDPYPIAHMDAEDAAGIFFTSGSTGVPKGVIYTHGIFAAQIDYLTERFAFEGNDVDLPTFPPFALFAPALGMTAVIPDMDASHPARADPAKLVEAIRDHGVTQMFGSPALIDRLSRYACERNIRLPSLRCVLSAGAPVRLDVLERMASVLDASADFYTPYGATEALPVSSISAREILKETRWETVRGGGICVGRPVPQVRVRIIRITDDPIASWSDDLLAPDGEVGEIVVEGPIVTHAYWRRPRASAQAKIRGPGGDGILHRMGDLGRLDERGRLWFLGRKAHRVVTASGTLFPVACEGVVNEHPAVFRSALVGVGAAGFQRPVLCAELERATRRADRRAVAREIIELCASRPVTRAIERVLFHPGLPVDRRHNAKIDRLALAAWAARRLR